MFYIFYSNMIKKSTLCDSVPLVLLDVAWGLIHTQRSHRHFLLLPHCTLWFMNRNSLHYDHAQMVEEKEACVARLQRLFHKATAPELLKFQVGPGFRKGIDWSSGPRAKVSRKFQSLACGSRRTNHTIYIYIQYCPKQVYLHGVLTLFKGLHAWAG